MQQSQLHLYCNYSTYRWLRSRSHAFQQTDRASELNSQQLDLGQGVLQDSMPSLTSYHQTKELTALVRMPYGCPCCM